ncbi:MAG: hypothetical protein JNM72_12510 [Deltaproteobacteria bacterium]|nr:hypothetical protein [Deltaproteobacteria bacterium]
MNNYNILLAAFTAVASLDFQRTIRNPTSNSTPNTEAGQLRNRNNNVNQTTFSTSETLSKGDAS